MNILDKVRQPENRLELKRYGKIDTKLLSMLKYYNYNPGNPIHNINSLSKEHSFCWMVEQEIIMPDNTAKTKVRWLLYIARS